MLSIIGLITILIIVILLMGKRFSPIVVLSIVPLIAALIAGFSQSEIATFYTEGINKVTGIAVMFIFAILFFGILQDIGFFDPLINFVLKKTGSNQIAITCGTVIIAAIAHIDGSGASTFLLTIPPLLPIYQRLKMSPHLLLLLVGLSAGIMNLIPWAGPMGRAGIILEMDPFELWKPLIPIQIMGFLLVLIMAFYFGWREKMKTNGKSVELENQELTPEIQSQTETIDKEHIKPLWLNSLIALFIFVLLFSGILPPGLIFMLGCSIILFINFPKKEQQMRRIKVHAPNALLMASIIIVAGSFMGILSESGMLESIANDLVKVLPKQAVPNLHYIIAFLGVPIELLLSTDATYFALFPVIEQIVSEYGVDSSRAIQFMMVGNIVGTFICPFAPAVWLAVGLANVELGKYIKYAFLWVWAFGIVLLLIMYLWM